MVITEEANGPVPDERVRVGEGMFGEARVESAAVVDGPETFERKLAVAFHHKTGEAWHDGFVPPVGEQALGGLPVPFVGMLEHVDKFAARELAEVGGFAGLGALGVHAIDTATVFMPGVTRVEMAQATVVPVGEIHRAIGAGFGVNDAEPSVVGGDHRRRVDGSEGGGVRINFTRLHAIDQRHAGDDVPLIIGQSATFVNDSRLREAWLVTLVRHVLIKPKRIRIDQRPVLAPVLDETAALRIMHAARVAVVGAGEGAAVAVEIEAIRIAAAFGEDLKAFGRWMIAPNRLAEKFDALNLSCACAAVRAVNPAVRSPAQAIRARVSVLQSKAGEMHRGVAIGNVVAILVRIKKQVRRHQHPCSTTTGDYAARHVQAVEESLVLGENAIAVGVLVDSNLVLATKMVGRGRRHLIKYCTQVLVVLQNLDTCWKGILQILSHPHSPAFIKIHIEWLRYCRLMGYYLHRQPLGHLQPFDAILRCGWLGFV